MWKTPMTKPTTQSDLDKTPLKEEVEGVRGDMQESTDVGEENQVDVAVVEDQVDVE